MQRQGMAIRGRWRAAFVLAATYSALALVSAGVRAWRERPDWRLVGRTAMGDHVWLNVRRPLHTERDGAQWWSVRMNDAATPRPEPPTTDALIDCARREVTDGILPGRSAGLPARAVAMVCGPAPTSAAVIAGSTR